MRKWLPLTALAALAVPGFINPLHPGAPRCLFKALTGLDCPGCGTQRAAYALFHGDVAHAWSLNPGLFVAVPLVCVYVFARGRLADRLYSMPAFIVLGIIIVSYWIGRNLF